MRWFFSRASSMRRPARRKRWISKARWVLRELTLGSDLSFFKPRGGEWGGFEVPDPQLPNGNTYVLEPISCPIRSSNGFHATSDPQKTTPENVGRMGGGSLKKNRTSPVLIRASLLMRFVQTAEILRPKTCGPHINQHQSLNRGVFPSKNPH